jgi:hypothetical protein
VFASTFAIDGDTIKKLHEDGLKRLAEFSTVMQFLLHAKEII